MDDTTKGGKNKIKYIYTCIILFNIVIVIIDE